MKFLITVTVFLLCSLNMTYGQYFKEWRVYAYSNHILNSMNRECQNSELFKSKYLDFSFLDKSELIYLNSGYSSQVIFLLDKKGNVIDKGYSNYPIFSYNQPAINFSGNNLMVQRDSMNPYGTKDIESALFLGIVNTFFKLISGSKKD